MGMGVEWRKDGGDEALVKEAAVAEERRRRRRRASSISGPLVAQSADVEALEDLLHSAATTLISTPPHPNSHPQFNLSFPLFFQKLISDIIDH